MDVPLLIRRRLKKLRLDQRDLAVAAQVTESYISQLLAGKKAPPSPGRTGIYEKLGKALQLPGGELSRLADLQRREELRKKVAEPPLPLFPECRELLLRKCDSAGRKDVARIFAKEPFGELERLVTQKLLDVAQGVARQNLQSDEWLRLLAQLSGRSLKQVRISTLEFLNTDVFDVSIENCAPFLNPIIDSWDIDLNTFGMRVVLNRRLAAVSLKRFEFTEQEPALPVTIEPGLEQFLQDSALSGDVTEEEIAFLKALKLRGKRPSRIYYYRELQNLRDPLHFSPVAPLGESD
jgi:transcriptional regulator with XRE-family HTH domain